MIVGFGSASSPRHNGEVDEAKPLLEVLGATVRYGSETVLHHVDFRMFPGEVHSLMGENGAGKSTLIKAITGVIGLDSGSIVLAGQSRRFASPSDALAAGISTVYQEIDLLPNLTVAENICLGREPRVAGVISRKAMIQQAKQALAELGIDVDPTAELATQSTAIQQLVAIARAISGDVKVLVLDEPTSSLDLDEVAELFRVIRELKSRGVAILFVSHFLDQVYEICDRVTVLRDGRGVGEYLTKELLRIDLVQKMLGHESGKVTTRSRIPTQEQELRPVLGANGVSAPLGIAGADVELFEGEVLAVAGLLGSGRTALARAVAGIDKLTSGHLVLDGSPVHFKTPAHALSAGVAYSSENRRSEGIVAELSVLDNITLALQADQGWRRIKPERQRELAASWVEALGIRPGDVDRPAGTLSGGNQQKVLLARLLALSPRVMVLDEPTRGIDIGAKIEILNLIGQLADNGMSVMFISAELEEVLRLGERVAVLRDGKLIDTMSSADLSVDSLLVLVAKPEPSVGEA